MGRRSVVREIRVCLDKTVQRQNIETFIYRHVSLPDRVMNHYSRDAFTLFSLNVAIGSWPHRHVVMVDWPWRSRQVPVWRRAAVLLVQRRRALSHRWWRTSQTAADTRCATASSEWRTSQWRNEEWEWWPWVQRPACLQHTRFILSAHIHVYHLPNENQ